MKRELLKYVGIGALTVAVVLAVVLYVTRGSHIELVGTIQKVRVQPMDENSSLVIVDFHFRNPADYPFIVRDATVYLERADGQRLKGTAVAAMDADRALAYYSRVNPALGPKYNESLVVRDRIEPKQAMDRMLCARFAVPAAVVNERRRILLRIQDVDGAVSEIAEKRRPGA